MSKLIRDERGDVPGWVLITIMTAGLVVAIWALAAPALGTVFDQAIDRVVILPGLNLAKAFSDADFRHRRLVEMSKSKTY